MSKRERKREKERVIARWDLHFFQNLYSNYNYARIVYIIVIYIFRFCCLLLWLINLWLWISFLSRDKVSVFTLIWQCLIELLLLISIHKIGGLCTPRSIQVYHLKITDREREEERKRMKRKLLKPKI